MDCAAYQDPGDEVGDRELATAKQVTPQVKYPLVTYVFVSRSF